VRLELSIRLVSCAMWITNAFYTALAIILIDCCAVIEGHTCRLCPKQWHYFEKTDSCYGKVSVTNAPYNRHEAFCTERGGHLASIHSAEEENFIHRFVSPNGFWLGMSRDLYSRWFWTDETIVNFVEWAPGEPNNYNEKEVCVYANRNGKWEDRKCDDRTISSSLCKKPAYTTDFGDED
uniref:C-type lectin domain-containing protein n=1 Tax=Parascaris univalens TaxID=6257 RepID=A0A914ZYJ0_PARUN